MNTEDTPEENSLLKEYFLNACLIALLVELGEEVSELEQLETGDFELDKVA